MFLPTNLFVPDRNPSYHGNKLDAEHALPHSSEVSASAPGGQKNKLSNRKVRGSGHQAVRVSLYTASP